MIQFSPANQIDVDFKCCNINIYMFLNNCENEGCWKMINVSQIITHYLTHDMIKAGSFKRKQDDKVGDKICFLLCIKWQHEKLDCWKCGTNGEAPAGLII